MPVTSSKVRWRPSVPISQEYSNIESRCIHQFIRGMLHLTAVQILGSIMDLDSAGIHTVIRED